MSGCSADFLLPLWSKLQVSCGHSVLLCPCFQLWTVWKYSFTCWTKATENFLILFSRNVQENEQGDTAAQVLHETQDIAALIAGESSEGWANCVNF